MPDMPSRIDGTAVSSPLLVDERPSIRAGAEQLLRTRLGDPAVRACLRLGIHPDAITGVSALLIGGAAVLLALGWVAAGGWLYLLGASLDALDGRVARARGGGTRAGAFLDSTLDRVGELLVLGGLALSYRSSPVLVAILVVAGASVVVSYARARGEALGASAACRVGVMQRPERVAVVGLACALSPVADVWFGDGSGYALIAGSLVLLAIATVETATARILAIYSVLSDLDRR
jgi:phosphatidylglycerophosphate synthase